MTKHDDSETAKAFLIKALGEKGKFYKVLRHSSSTGMTHRISLVILVADSYGNLMPMTIDRYVEQLTPFKQHERGGNVLRGGGMDMGFHLIDSVCHALGEGFECNSRDGGWLVRG